MHEDLKSARDGSRRSMARMLSHIENGVETGWKYEGGVTTDDKSWKIMAITGPPGVGKSVFIDQLMKAWGARPLKVALLAVDPSSPLTGGALLGDRIRMTCVDDDTVKDQLFVRSVGTRKSSGNVPLIVEDMAHFLLEVGWEKIIIETVGSGQAELRCAAIADRIVVVEGPGRGDGVQTEKAGLLELADVVIVNKSDLPGAEKHANELKESFALNDVNHPPVILTSALTGDGIGAAAELLLVLQTSPERQRAKARERLLAFHERQLITHPRYDEVLTSMIQEQVSVGDAYQHLMGENDE